ncbi:MAG: ATP-binding protein [Vicinamibacteria bacterium]|nr:ATP-binding protein [Vicinamibacteria bacterium]
MSERILGLLETVPNPFAHVRVDSAWETLAIDVPSINDSAFRHCQRLVDDVRATRQSHGLLLSGLPGAGKTHMLSRLRRWLYGEQHGSFVYIYPVTTPDRFYRHVLYALAGDVLRQPPEDSGFGQMEIAIARHVMGDDRASLDAISGWWDDVRMKHQPGLLLFDFLRRSMEPFIEDLALNEAVVMVVIQFVARLHRAEARAWLLGRPVTEEQSAILGVSGTLDEETLAADALFTLARFLGDRSTLVLAFDQIEGLQVERGDTAAIMSWANGLADLLARTQNMAIVTCAQISYLNDLRAAVGEALYDGRIAERKASLAPLTPAEAATLVIRRLKRSDDLQVVRMAYRAWLSGTTTDDDFWPFKSAEIEAQSALPEISARRLLLVCRELFEARRASLIGAVRPGEPKPDGAGAPRERLVDVFERARAEENERVLDKIDEGVYIDGLMRVIDLARSKDFVASRSRLRDVDLSLDHQGRSIDLAVCHAEDMRSLAARLRRLLDRQRQNELRRLVIVRDQRLPIGTRAIATQGYLGDLQRAGAVLLHPSAEVYAALAAIRHLLADAAAGDLTVDGKEVPPEDLKTWLAERLPTCVGDLIDEVVSGTTPETGGDLERLQCALRESCIMELAAAAQSAQLPADWARVLAERNPNVIGRIEGAPELLFLHPEAMDRS